MSISNRTMLVGGARETLQIPRHDVPALRDLCDAGVAGCAVDLVNAGAPIERPDESVFAATTADHKYIHTNPVRATK